MKLSHLLLLSAGLVLFGCRSEKKIQLFTNDSREEWTMEGPGNWSFKNGEIIAESDSGASFLMTTQIYENFELELEFFPDSTINSGVFIRCQNQQLSATECYEINIWDLHPNQEFRTGAVVTRASPVKYVETLNQWNTYLIRIQNNSLKAWINDIQTVELMDDDLANGYVGLQAAGQGTIKFRNVQLTQLSN